MIPYLKDLNYNFIYFNPEGWGNGFTDIETNIRYVDMIIVTQFLKNRGWTPDEFVDDINYNNLLFDEYFRTDWSKIPEDLAIVLADLHYFNK